MVRLELFALSPNIGSIAIANLPYWVQKGTGGFIETDEPFQQLSELVLGNIGWNLDYTGANPEEQEKWIVADLFARHLRAKICKKVVMLENKRVCESEFVSRLAAYCRKFKRFPVILTDDESTLVLGNIEEEDVEKPP